MAMKQRGMDRLTILRQLNREIRIPARYVSAAYDSIKMLPPHVTFGGKKAQQLRQHGKLTRAEYRRCRNRILACRGEKTQKGNLCLRLVDGHVLRVIIDVTSYDDITHAIEDGRLDKIVDEHTRYMKENDREIWAL